MLTTNNAYIHFKRNRNLLIKHISGQSASRKEEGVKGRFSNFADIKEEGINYFALGITDEKVKYQIFTEIKSWVRLSNNWVRLSNNWVLLKSENIIFENISKHNLNST